MQLKLNYETHKKSKQNKMTTIIINDDSTINPQNLKTIITWGPLHGRPKGLGPQFLEKINEFLKFTIDF